MNQEIISKYQNREKLCSLEEADGIAFGFTKKGQEEYEYIPFKVPEPLDDEVLIKVKYTGICHTDTLWSRGLWGDFVYYPCVPGHEIIGTVSKVGKSVKKLKVGDNVGFGFTANACGECHECKSGHDNTCDVPNGVTFHKHFGGWASHYVGKEMHAHIIPKEIPLEKAANLFCAGVTVFAPLRRYVKAGMKVGVVGIGGLGHLAIQIASAMGAHVTGITGTKSKTEEILKLGASDVILSEDIPKLEGKEVLDIILCCISDGDFNKYIKLLKKRGAFLMVGLPPADRPNKIDINYVVLNEIVVSGSLVGNDDDIEYLLPFAAKYQTLPMVELYSFDDFGKGVHRMEKERPRYRVTVKCESKKYPKFFQ